MNVCTLSIRLYVTLMVIYYNIKLVYIEIITRISRVYAHQMTKIGGINPKISRGTGWDGYFSRKVDNISEMGHYRTNVAIGD